MKILSLSLCITLVALCTAIFIAMHRGNTIANLNFEVKRLQNAVDEYQHITVTYAKAEKQAKDFEKELINDTTTDNLDVVPADYILKQLRAD